MISAKSIIGVVIIAILIGVLYVVYEKNFSGTPSLTATKTASFSQKAQEKIAPQPSSLLNLPTPQPSAEAINSSSDLAAETDKLEMRDYSQIFEDLKTKVKQ